MTRAHFISRHYLASLVILLQVVAITLGLMAFRHERGTYLVVFPERMILLLIIQVVLYGGLGLAVLKEHTIAGFAKAIVCMVVACTAAFFLYQGFEAWAFWAREYIR